jgi:hypothetical protein
LLKRVKTIGRTYLGIEELKPSSSFTNLYEIEQILDRKEGIRRNNLGAIVNSPLEEIEQQLAELVNKINNLKNV